MGRKIINTLLLISIHVCVCGQISGDSTKDDRFFIANGDTIWYQLERDWRYSEVAWLKNSRTRLFALVDTNLNVITEFKYTWAYPFSQGRNTVDASINNKWGVVNKLGEEIIKFEYSFPSYSFYDKTLKKEFYIFKKRHKEGVIDEDGNIVIPFDRVEIFNCGYGILQIQKGKNYFWYFLRTKKTISHGTQTVECSFYKSGKTIIIDEKTGKCGVIDTTGTFIKPCIYDRNEVGKFLK
ncbi:MAG: WG repeat-containing protein [Paludibacteraceae bacterium]|nr:WG repeat-containing protein [Paludibacteraceae bacterium]